MTARWWTRCAAACWRSRTARSRVTSAGEATRPSDPSGGALNVRFRMLLSEAWRSITANLSTTIAAAVTVLIGMALVGMLVGFGTYARSWTDKTKRELVVKVFFCTDQTCPQTG